jgi:hypothetical protein
MAGKALATHDVHVNFDDSCHVTLPAGAHDVRSVNDERVSGNFHDLNRAAVQCVSDCRGGGGCYLVVCHT